jgi:hypothetical protein
MYRDKQLNFSETQDIGSATSGSTTSSTNIIDLRALGMDETSGVGMELVILCQEAVTSAGSATVQFQLETATEVAMDTTNVVLVETPAIAKASLTIGTEVLRVPVPPGALQHLKVKYVVGGADLTAGMFDAFLTLDRQTNKG